LDLERENRYDAARQIGAGACVADVTDRESLDAAFRAAGTPDILIANAGRSQKRVSASKQRTSGTASWR